MEKPRFEVKTGSDHSCCFEAHIIDNAPVWPSDTQGLVNTPGDRLCETWTVEMAQYICDALNAYNK